MAKTVLLYFSGTGNSLAVVRKLEVQLEDAVVLSMLRDDVDSYVDSGTEAIGFVFPVYMTAVPCPVEEFLGTVTLAPMDRYVFAIATHGGVPGKTGFHLYRLLRARNISLDAYFELEMVLNTPKGVAPKPLMKMHWELDITEKNVACKLGQSDVVLGSIISSVQDREPNLREYLEHISLPMRWLMRGFWWMNGKSRPKLTFLVGEDCTGCGVCESVCMTKRIAMEGIRPQWVGSNCYYCYACFNFCPAQAIGVRHYTKQLGRYHHPEITADDIASQLK